MKVGILAGGFGTRLAEETEIRPKPMVEIGGMPILWHIMMIYSRYGHTDFCIGLGYKGSYIKRWFHEYSSYNGCLSVNTANGDIRRHGADIPNWNIDLVETGAATMTGGRIKRLMSWSGRERILMTWGDGLSDINLDNLIDFHESHGKLATMTAVRPPARYGHIEFDGDQVREFSEKPQTGEGWINGAFFVLEPEVFDYIEGDHEMFEHEPMRRLAEDGQLMAFRHSSFWQCMDTLREKQILQNLWDKGDAPWKTWA
ncbi:MAG: glucose-1-phosphate cytidylyltransferase [Pseudomonadota bacterium]